MAFIVVMALLVAFGVGVYAVDQCQWAKVPPEHRAMLQARIAARRRAQSPGKTFARAAVNPLTIGIGFAIGATGHHQHHHHHPAPNITTQS